MAHGGGDADDEGQGDRYCGGDKEYLGLGSAGEAEFLVGFRDCFGTCHGVVETVRDRICSKSSSYSWL